MTLKQLKHLHKEEKEISHKLEGYRQVYNMKRRKAYKAMQNFAKPLKSKLLAIQAQKDKILSK